ncbi:MAG: sensor histidine kinase [Aggregatilineales bacterium]
MTSKIKRNINKSLQIQRLQERLEEAEETLRAIKSGEVDAIVVSDNGTSQVFTLQGAERTYRLLVESMHEGAVTLSLSGLILYSNSRFARMLALPLEQVLGAAIRSFIEAPDLPKFEQVLSKLSDGEGHAELTLSSGTSTKLPCYFTFSILPNESESAICVVVTDLTEQKHVAALERQAAVLLERERIHEAEKKAHVEVERTAKRIAQLQTITALLAGALTTEDVGKIIVRHAESILDAKSGVIVLLNESGNLLEMIKAVDYKEQEAETLTPWYSFSIKARVPLAEAARLLTPIWIESPDVWRLRYPDLAQTIQQVDHQAWAMIPLLSNQQLLGTLGLAFPTPRSFHEEDRLFILTVAQQFAQALDRAILYRAEREARREAEAADLLKLQFLAMVSHELRTPLASIKGFASTLLSTDVSWDVASQQSYLTIIDEEADKLTELIEQLLDVSRLAAGKLSVTPQPIALLTVINRMMARLHVLTPRHHLIVNVSADLPPVMVDTERIMQVIGNLVGNATKFSPEQTSITISAFRNGSELQVTVSDEGPGIPPEERVRIFEAFRQIEGSGRNTKGAGLGLAICKGVVDAHGGKIWIAEKTTPGTVVSFTLPIASSYNAGVVFPGMDDNSLSFAKETHESQTGT